MSEIEILILALALALDALIVSICYGMMINTARVKSLLIMSGSFGFFQFLMPVLGWFTTGFVYEFLQPYSRWIVFVVFLVLGCKFMLEALDKKQDYKICCLSFSCVLFLALATSIDAFGAGISLKFSDNPILNPAGQIGIVTFVLSAFGFLFGTKIGKIFSKKIQVVGALLLFYLAINAIV